VNKIHATHFWVSMLTTLGAFIECKNRSDFQMGASTLVYLVDYMVVTFSSYTNLAAKIPRVKPS
jgi:hypothetical protein